MSETAQIYVSECCGAMFVPGHGPDNIHEAEEGAVIFLGPAGPNPLGDVRRCITVDERQAKRYDAIRGGECPACELPRPGLQQLDGGIQQ